MKTVVPNTYPLFRCIADRCRHTCCAGWEIDIDETTLSKYKSLPTDIGSRILSSIDFSDGEAHFRLLKDDKCPFLTGNGLCDLMLLTKDDSLLSDICRDHPRYRYIFSDREETGLGLCCEEACRISLGETAGFSLIELDTDGKDELPDFFEEEFFAERDSIFKLIGNRSLPIHERVLSLEKNFSAALPVKADRNLLSLFLSLEHLHPMWPEMLNSLDPIPKASDLSMPGHLQIPMEQLLCHLLFRHLSPSVDDDLFRERTGLCILIWRLAAALVKAHISRTGSCAFEELIEYVRMISSEIEYSDRNIDLMLDAFSER